ncbi:O-antigen ligase family protein [Amnibacterium flavum]|uniref:Exopolysaccharide production protein n=1 Tax=Amnibacterium flavum TaxID=2173173 RepID=A0A2V1HTI9_9MICO|nr:O-antigen ligase family protein [Amnibacterium flavum]PVZ95878.1 exopolysaccharide production protein [Amnibacterium flavum]
MAAQTRYFVLAVAVFFTLFAGEAIRNTLSWYGFAAWALVLLVLSIIALVTAPRRRDLPRRPTSLVGALTEPRTYLVAFLVWVVASLAWSAYPGGTVVGIVVLAAPTVASIALLVRLDRARILRALLLALTGTLVLSLLFELVVSLFVRRPVLPVFPIDVVPGEKIPQAFYWSRDLLFQGGPIQGILGNANLLGFVALLVVIISATVLRGSVVSRDAALMSLALGVVVLALTRSSTVLVAAVLVTVVAIALAIGARWPVRSTPGGERLRSGLIARIVMAAGVLAAVALVFALRGALLDLLGKSPDLTGRVDIWTTVLGLFGERPVAGWGWTGYWQPWIPLFADLAPRNGVIYLQAHNALLDVAFQLGVIGLILFVGLLVTTLVRAIRVRAVLPILLLVALLAQSIAESRLLYEGNWALLLILALTVGREHEGERQPDGADEAKRTTPPQ